MKKTLLKPIVNTFTGRNEYVIKWTPKRTWSLGNMFGKSYTKPENSTVYSWINTELYRGSQYNILITTTTI